MVRNVTPMGKLILYAVNNFIYIIPAIKHVIATHPTILSTTDVDRRRSEKSSLTYPATGITNRILRVLHPIDS